MQFRLLGTLEVSDGEGTVPLGGPKQRTVLAHLLLQPNRVVAVDRLIDALWGDEPPETARNTVQTYVRHLRKELGAERIQHRSHGYGLTAGRDEVDALLFEALVEEAHGLTATDAAAAVETFREALRLWRGPALDDLSDQESLGPEIARLEELRMAAIEDRFGAELELGRHAVLVPELEILVARHPLRERLWGHLILALYRSGRQADALGAYRRARELLADELGIDPSPELQRLHEQVLRQDRGLEVAGEPLRGYRLLDQIGAGFFGTVHRAFQAQVGREVAIKVIHPRFVNEPEFIRRFEAEAQFVARLEHPHIVPLYDFWREPDGAYLVMRYLRGGSLREALVRGPLAPEQAARILDQVALSLATAHREGVVHRDVKPANVLFDEDGNAYLSDFGIAKDLAAAEVASPGGTASPLAYYLSPEEIRAEPATPATDVYGLGFLLYEALAGRHPFAGTRPEEVLHKHLTERLPSIVHARPDLPGAVDAVIERATAKEPKERHPSAPDLAAAFQEALAPAPRRAIPIARGESPNPYKGLRPFLEADAADFFGREALTARLLDRMRHDGSGGRFLAVVGPSGSGKSSAVRAGLVPALKRGALPGSDRWFVVEMVPGTQPFQELALALTRVAVDPPADLAQRLQRDPQALASAVAEMLPEEGELLLVIDQFEEVFTLTPEELRPRFLASLLAAATDPGSRVRLVVTLRGDFYDRPLTYPRFGDLLGPRTEAVTPLSARDLERAISGPAERVGVVVDPALVADVVAEVAAQPGSLPLLQYALTELFEHREGSTLTVEAYRAIGGVSGALARRAEDLYGRLSEGGRQAVRQLFLRLVTLGEDGSEDTRRRVLRTELTALEVDRETMEAVIDTFGVRRLLSFDHDPVTRGPTVEVAHEALLREWARLRGWIEAAREDVRAHRWLASATQEWEASRRDPSFLLRGARLDRLEAWVNTSGLALTGDERAYIETSLAQREAERAEEESRRARETALERRSVARLRALVAVFAVLALVSSGLTVLTLQQRQRAEREGRVATARGLAAAAVDNLDVDPERSILLALEAVEATREADGTVLPEAEETLHRAVKRSRLILTVPQGGHGLDVTSDGTRFITGTSEADDDTAAVWDAETGERVLVVPGHEGPPAVAFSPDGRLIATTHNDGTARIRDAATGEEIHVLRGHEGPLGHPSFSPDGRRLATGGEDSTVRIWNVAAGTEEMTLTGHAGSTMSVTFSPEGTHVASASLDGTARIWDLATGATAMTLKGHGFAVQDVAFSLDGTRIATASHDGTARIWNARSGRLVHTFSGHEAPLGAVDFSPDGTRIATGASDGTARLWDAGTGEELMVLAGHTTSLGNVHFLPDGERLLTSGLDGTTRLWDISVGGARDWLTVPGATGIFTGVAFSPDGTRFAAPADPVGVTIWDSRTGEEVITLTGHEAKLTTVAFSPDGKRLAASSDMTDTPPVWDVDTGELLMTLTGHQASVRWVAFSPDGARIITGSHDRTAKVWDAATGQVQATLGPFDDGVFAAAFSADGRLIATTEFSTVRLWDSTTLEEVDTLSGHTDSVEFVTFAPGGTALTASGDGTAKIWDLGTREVRVTLRGHTGFVSDVAMSPDGTRVATASDDGTTKLWDAATGRELMTLYGHEELVFGVEFSPDGRLLATASPDGTVALHLLPIDEFVELAWERVTRDLTEEECSQYLLEERCPPDHRAVRTQPPGDVRIGRTGSPTPDRARP